MEISATEGIFTIKGSTHWAIGTSKGLDRSVSVREFSYSKDKVRAFTVFEKVKFVKDVTDQMKKVNNCKIGFIAQNDDGVIASVECKVTPLDRAVQEIVEKTHSRLWVKSNPDDLVSLFIHSPWTINLENTMNPIFKKYGLELASKPVIKIRPMIIPIPIEKDLINPKITEQDKEVAKTLLVTGYYSTPRPKGLTQDVLCKKLDMSKPTLEKVMTKIESLGIQKLFNIKPFTETEKQASLKLFKEKIKGKSKKK